MVPFTFSIPSPIFFHFSWPVFFFSFLGSFWCKIKISLSYKSINMSKFPMMKKTDGVTNSARAVDLQEWLRAFGGEWVNPLERVGPQASLMRDFCSQLWYFRWGITKALSGKTLPTVRHNRLNFINIQRGQSANCCCSKYQYMYVVRLNNKIIILWKEY